MFEIRRANKRGTFHVQIHSDIVSEEMEQLCQLAINLLGQGDHSILEHNDPSASDKKQTKLGEKPVNDIAMGAYDEPSDGVRIKMVHFPKNRSAATRIFRDATGISIVGCCNIVSGNYPCPLLTEECANYIINRFKDIDVYAKIVREQLDAA